MQGRCGRVSLTITFAWSGSKRATIQPADSFFPEGCNLAESHGPEVSLWEVAIEVPPARRIAPDAPIGSSLNGETTEHEYSDTLRDTAFGKRDRGQMVLQCPMDSVVPV
jgi:hypothetical protein